MHVTIMQGDRDSLNIRPIDATTEELKRHLSTFKAIANKEKGLALMPCRFRECPEAACKNKGKVDCGGGRLHRLNANVVEMTGVGIDLDDTPDDRFNDLIASFMARGLEFYVWHTYSHKKGSGKTRARVLLPLATPMPINHPAAWSKGAWPALMKWLGVDRLVSHDEKCKDPARLYFMPAHPEGVEGHESDYHPGNAIDWTGIVGDTVTNHIAPDVRPEDFSTVEETENAVDLESLRERLKRMRVESWKPLIRNVLQGLAPVPPPEQREPGMPTRENAWFEVTMALAMARDDHENKSSCLELLKDAYVDGSRFEGFTPWEKIVDQFERACEKARLGKAERKARERADLENWKQSAGIEFGEGGPTDDEAVAPEEGKQPDPKWADRLLHVQAKSGPVLRNCTANAELILSESPAWFGVLRFNRVSNKIEMHGGPLLPDGVVGTYEHDTAAKVSNWLQRQDDEFALFLDDSQVFSRIHSAALSNQYDPLQDYLNGLEWDGVSRLDTAATAFFNADVTPENHEYAHLVVRRWFISAVARGLDPGCKVDTVLILEGHQGARKTSAFSELAGEFFTDQYIDTQNKDSLMLIAQSWIAELGELETLRRAQVEAIKQFLSQRRDQFRVPYGRGVQAFPRRCVFVGTTNRDDYLRDETGNRRYWPLKCGSIDLAAIRAARDQLWAEAVTVFKTGGKENCPHCAEDAETRCMEHRWWFTADEAQMTEVETEKRAAQDPIAEKISEAYLSKEPGERPAQPTINELMQFAGIEDNHSLVVRTGPALKRLGFKKERVMAGDVRRVLWVAPESILSAPVTARAGSKLMLAEAPILPADSFGLGKGN